MRNILLASAAVLALAMVPASAAATDSETVHINGNIALKCSLTVTNPTLDLGEITTGNDGKHAGNQTSAAAFLDGAAMCNGAKNTIVVTAHPLTTTTPLPVGSQFTKVVDYTLAVGTLLPGTVVLNTSNPFFTSSTQHDVPAFANTGSRGVVTTIQTTKPVIAGSYSATVDITLTAAN